jgi:hypothetical protein
MCPAPASAIMGAGYFLGGLFVPFDYVYLQKPILFCGKRRNDS